MRSNIAAIFTASVLSVALAACGGNKNEKIDYSSPGLDLRSKPSVLEVPPDLVSPSRDNRYALPEAPQGTATYSTYAASRDAAAPGAAPATPAATAGNVPAASSSMTMQRDGNTRWLVTTLPRGVVWAQLQDFWKNLGFVLVKNDDAAGIMETDWVENRAKIAGDPIQRALSTVLGSLVSNGERDRYRTRIEPSATRPGAYEIYVSHRGAEELRYRDRDGTYWELRPANPELEAEMLQRIMVALGTSPEVAKKALEDTRTVAQPERASVVTGAAGAQEIVVKDGLDRAWRSVGLALDRIGVVVEDRDRAKGLYFVRYVGEDDLEGPQKDQGLFARWFGGKKKTSGTNQYQVSVTGNDSQTLVKLLDKDGKPAAPEANRQIMTLLHAQLK